MKKLLRTCVSLIALLMITVTCLGFVGCKGDMVKVELQLEIYDASGMAYDKEDTKLTIEFYRHLAPETVDAIVGYIQDGYYDNAIFYGMGTDKIMMGDLKMNQKGQIVQMEQKPNVNGEFDNAGVKGSNLQVEEGSIALWRTWAVDDSFNTTKNLDTGRATWFMPTGTISTYQGNFCVFATIDLEASANKTTWEYIKTAINDNSETYKIYYTGEYDALEFHCEEEVPEDQTVFEPEGEELVCYRQYDIKVAKGVNNLAGARIVSAKVI